MSSVVFAITKAENACFKCRWCARNRFEPRYSKCFHPDIERRDRHPEHRRGRSDPEFCDIVRSRLGFKLFRCGPDGHLFEPRKTVWEHFKGLFNRK